MYRKRLPADEVTTPKHVAALYVLCTCRSNNTVHKTRGTYRTSRRVFLVPIVTAICTSGWIEMTNLLRSDFQETSADLLINTLQKKKELFSFLYEYKNKLMKLYGKWEEQRATRCAATGLGTTCVRAVAN